MGAIDVSKLTYDDICELCKCYLRGTYKPRRGLWDIVLKVTKWSNGGGVTKDKIGNMFDKFKTDILIILNS
jgi:hypothetical protein